MGKSKVAKTGAPSKDALKSVKDAGVAKPSQTPKSKSKEIAKDFAKKHEKKSKKVKEPTPVSSDSESESEDESMSDASSATSSSNEKPVMKQNGVKKATSDSESGSDSDSEDSATEKAAPKANGVAKKASKVEADSSESSESSDSSESSEDSDEDAKPPATAGKQESESEDDSEDSESDSDAEAKTKGPVNAKDLKGKLEKASAEASSESEADSGSSDGSGSVSEEGSDAGSDSSDESEEEAPGKKRKAEEVSTPAAKKSKVNSSVDDDAKRNLFVGQLSWNVDDDWLYREFISYGEIESASVVIDKSNGRSKGFGYVKFVDPACGEKAQAEKHRSEVDGRAINVDFNKPKDDSTPRTDRSQRYGDAKSSPESSTLFVANISFEATDDTLRDEFGQHAQVVGARLPTDRDTGAPKGFGYVEFASVEEAKKAFAAMSGAKILGRPIRLDYSTPRDNNSSPGNFRGGGRGGGRGGFDRGGRGGGRGRGGFDRGGRGGGRGGSTNRGGFGDFQGKKMSFS